MRTLRLSLTLGAMLALFACGGGGGTAGQATLLPPVAPAAGMPPVLPVIPEVVSSNGVAELTLQAKFDGTGRPAFFYNGQEIAPTIRVNPGDTIKLHFQNSLPEFCAVGVVSNSNLHFHGLTSSPNAPADDVITTNAQPGAAVDYVVPINTDQPPGMYWYHPHPHGLSSWEVGNGMAGIIIVEGIANEVPATAGLRERDIVLQDVPNDASLASGESSLFRRISGSRRATGVRGVLDEDSGGNSCGPETDATPMINGVTRASIGIKPGETELFRVLNASGHRHFDLYLGGLTMTIVAEDGVPIDTYPGAPQTITATDVVIPPAGRVEFLVTSLGGQVPITSNCYHSGPAGDANPQVSLGILADDTNWPPAAQAQFTDHVRRITSLQHSQFYRVPLPAPAAQRLVHFQEDDNGFYINGQQYSPTAAPQIVASSGTVEEWTLENDTQEVHSFHIHQVHFVVESINGAPPPAAPHWVDTIDIQPEGVGVSGQLTPSLTKVLVDFRDPIVRGTFVYHCHILDHEDGGMMAKITVQ